MMGNLYGSAFYGVCVVQYQYIEYGFRVIFLVAYRVLGGSNPLPRNSEILRNLSQIPSSMENTSITTNKNTDCTHLQVEQNT
jgi:hypothetical protein